MNRDEINNEIVETEKKLREVINNHSIVTTQYLRVNRLIAKLNVKKTELRMALSKSSTTKKELESKLREFNRRYWMKE